MVKNGKKRGKSTQKKLYKRRKLEDSEKAVICYCPKVAPDVMRVHLTFNQNYAISASTSDISTKVFRGNSIFDPDTGTTPTQPLGYEQWATLYRRYRVIASRAEIRFMADGSAVPLTGVVVPMTSSVVYTDPVGYKTSAYAKQVTLGTSLNTGFGDIESYMSTDKIRGMPRNGVRVAQELSSIFASDPTQQWFWHVSLCADDNSTTWEGVMNVTIVYDVELYDRANLSQSPS